MQGAFGTKVKITVSASLTAIANLLDVDDLVLSKTLANMRAHDSPGGYAEYVDTGVRDISELAVTLGWEDSDSTHAAITAAFASTTPVAMSIEDPTGTEVISFNAHIRQMARMYKQTDGYKCKVSIQPTGQPTIV